MTDIYNFFLNKIKEKHILDEILIMKKRMELLMERDKLFDKYYCEDDKWFYISMNEKLHIDFLREFKEDINWRILSNFQLQGLTEDVIKEFIDRLNIKIVLRDYKVSENFLREFHSRLDWFFVSTYQNLSEDFIRDFHFKLHWKMIFKYQNLSEDFKKEFQYKLN